MNGRAIFGFCIITLLLLSSSSFFFLSANHDVNHEQVQVQEESEKIIPICNREYFDYLHAELQNASQSIHIVQFQMRYYPGYTGSHSNMLLDDLIEANKRGVDVKVMLEGGEDFLGENFTEYQTKAREYLEKGGVKVKFDGKGVTTHAKLIIIDERVVILGSTNWNYYSLDRNNEASVLIKSNEAGIYYENYFEKLWNQWDIKINEFMPDSTGSDDANMPEGEWVELYNVGEANVNVSGWVLYDSNNYHELYITPSNTNTGDTIVPASGFLLVYRNGDDDFSLNNRGYEEVRLYDGYPPSRSTAIDIVSYTGSEENKSWARIPDGTGNLSISKPTPGLKNALNMNMNTNKLFDTNTSKNPYPSIFGTHRGTITPNQTIKVSRMFTYSCPGTGGHSEYVAFFNATTGDEIANGTWSGYQGAGDYHYIVFENPFLLKKDATYNYTICTGSYPQIHHTDNLSTPAGFITCSEFIDSNGRSYNNWIPAIRLEGSYSASNMTLSEI